MNKQCVTFDQLLDAADMIFDKFERIRDRFVEKFEDKIILFLPHFITNNLFKVYHIYLELWENFRRDWPGITMILMYIIAIVYLLLRYRW